jgi:ribosomal protein S18 acetylase RimI-like enzyme
MRAADIEAIERATIAAVSPEAIQEVAGWILPFDSGTVGRAKSAVPLSHEPPDLAVLPIIEERYAARGLPLVLRVPVAAPFHAFCRLLERKGYVGDKPTQVHIAETSVVRKVSSGPPAEIAMAPDQGWASVFLGEGFDPVDGASRVKILSRAAGTLFASVRDNEGRTVAAGAASFAHGWASVHGMRTALACRGHGFAGRVLATLAAKAQAHGYERMFLQVTSDSTPALALYRRAGFEPAWTYLYWRKG